MNLINAVKSNNLEQVRLLVEQGADKEKGDDNIGWTPLMWASFLGQLEIAQYLVEQGASLEKATKNGGTPLAGAVCNGHLEVCRYLLEQGADRDKADKSGQTSLHIAAYCGYLDVAMLLMSYGADLNARDKDGKLPIDVTHHEEIKQAIRDEPRRRLDEAPGKRATEEDRHPNAVTSASTQQGEENEVNEEHSNKRPRLNEGVVAEEDQDSEPSDEEEDHD